MAKPPEPEPLVSVMAKLRAGDRPASEILAGILRWQNVDTMRGFVEERDFGWIRELCESPDEATQHFGLALIRPIGYLPEVKSCLRGLLDQENLAPRLLVALQFEMLSHDAIEPDLEGRFLDWTFANWDDWLAVVSEWIGGADKVLAYASSRLQDHGTPARKRWLYCCALAGADDREAAVRLLRDFSSDADPRVRDVAGKVLQRMGAHNVTA